MIKGKQHRKGAHLAINRNDWIDLFELLRPHQIVLHTLH
jgi:hypothetical protein